MLKAALLKSHFTHGCSPVNLLHIFRTPFLNNNSGWLLLRSESNCLRVGLLYNIKVKENTVRQREELNSIFFAENFVFLIMVLVEFSPLN